MRGAGARLQRALVALMLARHTTAGYEEIGALPLLLPAAALEGTGQLPRFADEQYRDADAERWLSPTAEVQLTNLHAGEILAGDALPRRYVAHSVCFRRERAAGGRDTRGIVRGHQFEKVELVQLVAPADEDAAFATLLDDARGVLRALELPHRVVALAADDLGVAAARTHDLEVWAPGLGAWLEVSSVSACGDFQALRAGLRYRDAAGAVRPVHTLNGSALALPRTLIDLLAHHQDAAGCVALPAALRPYVDGLARLAPTGGAG